MKNKILKGIMPLSVATMILLTGCSSNNEIAELQKQIDDLEARLTIEEQLSDAQGEFNNSINEAIQAISDLLTLIV